MRGPESWLPLNRAGPIGPVRHAKAAQRRSRGETQMSTSFDTEFTGKRALVTGGTRGMGAAIVQRLRGAGATVVTTARSARS
jgi:3-oxoacyl-ACP reductase-like protein